MARFTPSDGGKGSDRRDGTGYEDNYEAIFGKKEDDKPKSNRGTFVFDPKTGTLVPKSEYVSEAQDKPQYAAIHGDIKAFVSPIDGSVIDDRSKLREHNRKHGVTNAADYSQEYLKKRREANKETPRQAKEARVEAIKKARYLHGYRD